MSDRGESIRRVVFHADDFGMNAAVNLGILTAFREGLLTSTSLLANAPAAEAACQAWPELVGEFASGDGFGHSTRSVHESSRHTPCAAAEEVYHASSALVGEFSAGAGIGYGTRSVPATVGQARRELDDPHLPFDLGIHLNLTQGRPLTGEHYPAQLLDPHGNFPGIGNLFVRLARATHAQLNFVESELHAQVEWMCDHGRRPTHLNGHQYIEIIPQVSALIPQIVRRYAIPTVRVALERGLVRNVLIRGDIAGWGLAMVKRHYAKLFRRRMSHSKIPFPDRFFGTSHAGRIDGELISRFLSQSMDAKFAEIGVHPAITPSGIVPANDPWFDPLAELRPKELAWLCGSELAEELRARGLKLGRLGSLSTAIQASDALTGDLNQWSDSDGNLARRFISSFKSTGFTRW